MVGDGLGEAFDAAMFFFGNGNVGELLEAGDEGAAEAVQTIAVGEDGVVFDAVEVAADLFGGVDAVVEIGDEAGDGTLEVDVVLPQGVVGVDEQGLAGGASGMIRGLVWGEHRLIIRRFCGASVTKVRRVCHGWGMSDPVGVCQIGSND